MWGGTVTVGSDPAGSGAVGYSAFAIGMGSITSPDFVANGKANAVDVVAYSPKGLHLALSRELSIPFTLHIEEKSFESSSALTSMGAEAYIYTWSQPGLTWTIGESVPVFFDSRSASQGASANSPATGTPTLIGSVQAGQTLTVDASGMADDDGLTNVSYAYQWIANDGTSDSDIEDASSSSYTIASGDVGKTIKVKVSFTDDEGNEETLTSAATPAVTAAVPGAPSGLAVSPHDTGKLDLTWDAPDSDGGATITGYKVQWKEAANSWDTPADVSKATVSGSSHTVSGLTDGTEYTFRVLAVNSVGDSGASGETTGTPKETTAPTVSAATVDGSTLTITFSEDLAESPVPATAAFSVTVGGATSGVDSVAISGSTVTLALASAVASGEPVTVDYTLPTDGADARLKDLNGNAADSFSGQQVTNNTAAPPAPLTASSHDVPSSPRWTKRDHLRTAVQREPGGVQLQDP